MSFYNAFLHLVCVLQCIFTYGMCFYNVFWTGPTSKLAHSKHTCFFTTVILQRFSPDNSLNKFIANLI